DPDRAIFAFCFDESHHGLSRNGGRGRIASIIDDPYRPGRFDRDGLVLCVKNKTVTGLACDQSGRTARSFGADQLPWAKGLSGVRRARGVNPWLAGEAGGVP